MLSTVEKVIVLRTVSIFYKTPDHVLAEVAIEKEKTAAAQKEAAAAKQAVPPPAVAAGAPLPLGTVVATLPGGCTPTPVGGVNYYYCGGNFYQAVYEGSTLKYITAKPK